MKKLVIILVFSLILLNSNILLAATTTTSATTTSTTTSPKSVPISQATIPNDGHPVLGNISNSSSSYTVQLINKLDSGGSLNGINNAANSLAALMFTLFLLYLGLNMLANKQIKWMQEIGFFMLSMILLIGGGQDAVTMVISIVNNINNTALDNMSGSAWFFGLLNLHVLQTNPSSFVTPNPVVNLWNIISADLSSLKLIFGLIIDFILMGICKLLIWVILAFRNIILVILWAFAPIIAALSIFPPYRKILIEWVKELVIISSWKFVITLSNLIIYSIAQSTFKEGAGNTESVALVLLGTIMIIMTPKITRAIFEGGLSKGFNEAIKTTIAAAAVVAAVVATGGAAAAGGGAAGGGGGSAALGTSTNPATAGTASTGTAGSGSAGSVSAGSGNSAGTPSTGTSGSSSGSTGSSSSGSKVLQNSAKTALNASRKAKEKVNDDKTNVGDNKQ